jgi:hypothetical protein
MAIMDISAAQEVLADRDTWITTLSQAQMFTILPEACPKASITTRIPEIRLERHALFFSVEPGMMSLLALFVGISHLQFFNAFSFIAAGGHVSIVDSRPDRRTGWCVPC